MAREVRGVVARFVSEEIGLDAVERAFHRMEAGEVLRSVVVL
jgi:S-(hydroxymethyl)mycothiol dehydrogenase